MTNILSMEFSHGWMNDGHLYRIEAVTSITGDHSYIFSIDGVRFQDLMYRSDAKMSGGTVRPTGGRYTGSSETVSSGRYSGSSEVGRSSVSRGSDGRASVSGTQQERRPSDMRSQSGVNLAFHLLTRS